MARAKSHTLHVSLIWNARSEYYYFSFGTCTNLPNFAHNRIKILVKLEILVKNKHFNKT